MRRAGVLRLVHQYMVNAAVDPVQHPGRDLLVIQQAARLVDQIVKVQPAAQLFGLRIMRQKRCRKPVQAVGLARGGKAKAQRPRVLDPAHQVL